MEKKPNTSNSFAKRLVLLLVIIAIGVVAYSQFAEALFVGTVCLQGYNKQLYPLSRDNIGHFRIAGSVPDDPVCRQGFGNVSGHCSTGLGRVGLYLCGLRVLEQGH